MNRITFLKEEGLLWCDRDCSGHEAGIGPASFSSIASIDIHYVGSVLNQQTFSLNEKPNNKKSTILNVAVWVLNEGLGLDDISMSTAYVVQDMHCP